MSSTSDRCLDDIILLWKKPYLLCIIGVCYMLPKVMTAQSRASTEDSLRSVLNTAKNTDRVQLLNALAWELKARDMNTAQQYVQESLSLARQANNSKGIAQSLDYLGVLEAMQAKYTQALERFYEAARLYAQIQDSVGIALVNTHVGNTHYALGNYPEALRAYLQAKRIAMLVRDARTEAKALNNIGNIFEVLQDWKQANQMYLRARAINQRLSSWTEVAVQELNISSIYLQQQDLDSAYRHAQIALRYYDQYNDLRGKSAAYNCLAQICIRQRKTALATSYLDRGLEIHRGLGDKEGIARNGLLQAKLSLANRQPDKAIEQTQAALLLAQSINLRSAQQEAYQLLAQCHEQKQEYAQALVYERKFIALKDSILSGEKSQQLLQIQKDFDLIEEQRARQQLTNRQAQQDRQLDWITRAMLLMLGVLLLTGGVAWLFFRRFQARKQAERNLSEELKQRNAYLEKLNKDLTRVTQDLDNFLYKVSHDVKGPISTLEGLCNLGLMDTQDPVAINYFNMQKKVIAGAQLLIFRFVEIGDIRHHQIKATTVRIPRLLRQIVRSMSRAERSGAEIKFQTQLPDELNIETDPEMLEIALDNIIQNAMQHARYFSAEGQTPEVKVSAVLEEGNMCRIDIIDNGYGISNEVADKIFDMFFKGSNEGKGFGLGLYKVKIAIEKIQGRVQLSKSDQKETIFTIHIPTKIPPPDLRRVNSQAQAPSTSQGL